MSDWTASDLAALEADELQVSSTRRDGSDRPFVTIWMVSVGDRVFARSAYGPDNGWYRRALASGTGRVRVGALERAVTYSHAESAADLDAVDAAYRDKYGRRYASIVGGMVTPEARPLTVELAPAD